MILKGLVSSPAQALFAGPQRLIVITAGFQTLAAPAAEVHGDVFRTARYVQLRS